MTETKVSKFVCKKLMKEILIRQNSRGFVDYPDHIDFLSSVSSDPVMYKALDFLAAKELVTYTIDLGQSLTCIHVENRGATYFEDIEEMRKKRAVEWTRYIITTAIAVAAFIKSFFF